MDRVDAEQERMVKHMMNVDFVATKLCHDAGVAYADVATRELRLVELDRLTGVPHYGYNTSQPAWPFPQANSVYRHDVVCATAYRTWAVAEKILGVHGDTWLMSPVNTLADRNAADGADEHDHACAFLSKLTKSNLIRVDHQLAHAYTVAADNQMTSGKVVTLDGVGDGCGGVFDVHPDGTLALEKRRLTFSLGELYDRLTAFFICHGGQPLGKEGTFMAYAGLGKPTAPIVKEWVKICNLLTTKRPWAGLDVYDKVNAVLADVVERYDPVDVAATCHKLWVDAAEAYVVTHVDVDQPLGFAGGSALNCALNYRLARRWGQRVCWTPTPGDCGQPLGMIRAELIQRGTSTAGWVVRTMPVLDPENVPVVDKHADPDDVAKLLATGQVVAVMRGEIEAGPRALGRRSILASPLIACHRERLNRLKGRELFRPFGVMIPRERLRDFTDLDVDLPWMNVTIPADDKQLPAAVHADSTTRVQTVMAADDPWLHALLTAFGQRTGVYAVINTSLNTHGRAIFNKVSDTLELLGHGVDAMVVDNKLIEK